MKTKRIIVSSLSAIFLIFASFFMYDFYKCLSGFIANGFREPLVMLPMVLSYLLPVLCFFFFFYDFYVKSIHKVAKIVICAFVIIYAFSCLALIFNNISLYISNSSFGVYDALPSIIVHFPYDMIILHIVLIILHAFLIYCAILKESCPSKLILGLKQHGFFKLHILEYIAFCVLAIVAFVFLGAGITGIFTALSNAFYDFRYIYLILWAIIVPIMNLLYLVFKPERTKLSFGARAWALGVGIGVNLIFSVLLLIFELTYPDFIAHVGKPIFLIAFSVSLPIEMGIILGFSAIGTVAMGVKLIIMVIKRVRK